MAVTIANSATAGINYGRWPAISNLTQFTISAWVRIFSFGASGLGRIASKENGWLFYTTSNSGGVLQIGNGFSGGTANFYSSLQLPSGAGVAWTHVAATWDGAGPAISAHGLWIGGVLSGLVQTATATGSKLDDSGIDLWIGNRSAGSRVIDGQIAEVGIWNALLTPAEITALSKGFSPSHIRPTAMRFHAPLIRDFRPLQQNATIASSGVTVAPHPRIIL